MERPFRDILGALESLPGTTWTSPSGLGGPTNSAVCRRPCGFFATPGPPAPGRNLDPALLVEINAVLDNALVGIAVTHEQRLVSCNRRMEEIFAYDAGELNGRPVAVFAEDACFQAIWRQAARDLAGAAACRRKSCRRRNGEVFWGRSPAGPTIPTSPRACAPDLRRHQRAAQKPSRNWNATRTDSNPRRRAHRRATEGREGSRSRQPGQGRFLATVSHDQDADERHHRHVKPGHENRPDSRQADYVRKSTIRPGFSWASSTTSSMPPRSKPAGSSSRNGVSRLDRVIDQAAVFAQPRSRPKPVLRRRRRWGGARYVVATPCGSPRCSPIC